MNARTAILPLVLLAALAVAACSGGNGAPEEEAGLCPSKTPAAVEVEGELTVEELTDLVAEAITCPGYAFHFRSAGEYEAGPYSAAGEADVWIDIENNLARTDSRATFNSAEARRDAEEAGEELQEVRERRIIRADGSYTGEESGGYAGEEWDNPAAKRQPPSCHGPGREALDALISCEPLADFETTIERDVSYRGQPAIALVSEGEHGGSDETYYTTNRLYFHRDTFLPIGSTSEGTLDVGDIFPIHADSPIEFQFVPLDSLASDFFDPASFGYVEKPPETPEDPEEPLERTDLFVPVYWLGREFEGSGEYPALALEHADAQLRGPTAIRAIVNLRYRPSVGYTAVTLALFTPEGWNNREGITLRQPCEETIELNIAGVQATLQRHYWEAAFEPPSCLPHDRFSATVYFDDVVVRINAPSIVLVDGTVVHSPYASEKAMELLVRSLRLRE